MFILYYIFLYFCVDDNEHLAIQQLHWTLDLSGASSESQGHTRPVRCEFRVTRVHQTCRCEFRVIGAHQTCRVTGVHQTCRCEFRVTGTHQSCVCEFRVTGTHQTCRCKFRVTGVHQTCRCEFRVIGTHQTCRVRYQSRMDTLDLPDPVLESHGHIRPARHTLERCVWHTSPADIHCCTGYSIATGSR